MTFGGGAAFASGSSYVCTASDATANNIIRVTPDTGTNVTFLTTAPAGGGNVVNWICVGH